MFLRPCPPLALALLALFQFIAAGFARLTGHGQSIESLAARGGVRPPEVPAGYAFSIWFVIFTLSVIYALYYAAKGRDDEICRNVSWPAAILFACSSAWMIAAQTIGDGWHLVFLIVIMWAMSVQALLVVRFSTETSVARSRILLPLFGLFTGWLTVAMFLNITGTTARTVGMLGLDPTSYALLTLAPAGLLALALQRRLRGEVWTLAAVLWALAAIIVANLAPLNTVICAVSAAFTVALVVFWTKMHRVTVA